MRYVPNLIPDKSKVLGHYFKGNIHKPKKVSSFQNVLRWIGGLFFMLIALSFLKHLILTLLFGLIGFMILPPGHNWLEKKFRFNLTTKIKSFSGVIIFLFSLPLLGHYDSLDKKEAQLLKFKIEQEEKLKAEFQKKEKIRKDSLIFFINESKKQVDIHKTVEAKRILNKASFFARLPEDKEKIVVEENNIAKVKAFDFVDSGQYKLAIPLLDTLISDDDDNAIFFYKRAVCYSKTGKIGEAVVDCKTAVKLGDTNAEKLHDKINPIKKRIAYYVTRCCDGTTSSSSGRGTCSHHGGVCNWSEPVYEEYRKYE
ncbi:hypothetical protein ACFFLS_13585 [Flavobacterium procerum]|uniref:DUF3761 domain-containing protein n=1 Tax=Flavobacterium procerum TaxID=1455569 RepID=A0ABV6BRJ6_9FLAO